MINSRTGVRYATGVLMSTDFAAQMAEFAEPQDGDAQTLEAAQNAADMQPDEEQRPSSDDQGRNWRALRDKAESAERRAQMLENQVSEYTSLIKDFVSGKKQEPEEEEIDETDIPTFGQTKKVARKEAERIAEDRIRAILAERDQLNAPMRLKSEFADFEEVVSNENVDYLIKKEPELAAILRETKDQYSQGKAAYKFIKSLGIHKKDVEVMKQDASRNSAKPVSPNLSGKRSSVGDANIFAKGLTPELKKQLHKEMLESYRK